MARKRINLSLPDELYLLVEQESEKSGTSMAGYVTNVIMHHLKDTELEADASPNFTVDRHKRTIHLDDEEAYALHYKAVEAGLTEMAYVRNMLLQDMNFIEVGTDDLDRFIDEIHSVTSDINSLVYMIRTKGEGKVFEQDIAELKELGSQISLLLSENLKAYYKDRKKICNKMTTQISKGVRK